MEKPGATPQEAMQPLDQERWRRDINHS